MGLIVELDRQGSRRPQGNQRKRKFHALFMCILHRNNKKHLLNQNRRAKWDNMAIIIMKKNRKAILLIVSACILAGSSVACSKDKTCICTQYGISGEVDPAAYGASNCSQLSRILTQEYGEYTSCN